MWDVKEPTHYSKRVGREVSWCCGCPLCCSFRVGASHRVTAFLMERSQAVRIGNSLGGIPQGMKLGVILFAMMTNNLLREWHLRKKFVVDTMALEMLPSNGISLRNRAVNDIHKLSMERNMKFIAKKCKEMLINFMQNDNFTTRPIVLGNNTVERVTTYKLLDIIISNDLKWSEHIDYISKKASKCLYSLRILKKLMLIEIKSSKFT